MLTAVTLERAVRLQSIAATLGRAAADRPRSSRRAPAAEKYQDAFLDEYWAAWERRVERRERRAALGGRIDLQPQRPRGRAATSSRRSCCSTSSATAGLTGAKRSCDVQVCGTCTVLVDGLPVSSCTYLAAETDGRDGD